MKPTRPAAPLVPGRTAPPLPPTSSGPALALALAAFAPVTGLANPGMSSANYSILPVAFSAGGGPAASSSYQAFNTLAAGPVGSSESANYKTQYGFAPGAGPLEVTGRYVFYNRSVWDGNNEAATPADDAAIATDKTALRPGSSATFANYTSYSRGLNGIMVDVPGLSGTPSASDFVFKAGNTVTPGSWGSAPAPTSVTVRPGAGTAGADRVTLIWADNAIQKQWLEIRVKATPATGLSVEDVFYFGNAIGDTGNSALDAQVNSTDVNGARSHPRFSLNPAPITDLYDFNRDKLVNSTDVNLARIHTTFSLNALKLITPPLGDPRTALAGLAPAGDDPSAESLAGLPVPQLAIERLPDGALSVRVLGASAGDYRLEFWPGSPAGFPAPDPAPAITEVARGEWTIRPGAAEDGGLFRVIVVPGGADPGPQ